MYGFRIIMRNKLRQKFYKPGRIKGGGITKPFDEAEKTLEKLFDKKKKD